MSLSLIGARTLRGRALHEPLGELAAAPAAVEPHDVAVVVDLLDRPSGTLVIRARSGGDGHVAIDGNGGVGGVEGALGIPRRGSLVLSLAEPRFDNRVAAEDRVVVRVVAVFDVVGEECGDAIAVIRLPRLDVLIEPAGDIRSVHRYLLSAQGAPKQFARRRARKLAREGDPLRDLVA